MKSMKLVVMKMLNKKNNNNKIKNKIWLARKMKTN